VIIIPRLGLGIPVNGDGEEVTGTDIGTGIDTRTDTGTSLMLPVNGDGEEVTGCREHLGHPIRQTPLQHLQNRVEASFRFDSLEHCDVDYV
jgi:hypothetical protein